MIQNELNSVMLYMVLVLEIYMHFPVPLHGCHKNRYKSDKLILRIFVNCCFPWMCIWSTSPSIWVGNKSLRGTDWTIWPLFPSWRFKKHFLNGNHWILVHISQKSVSDDPSNNGSALVYIVVWRRTGDKLLPYPMFTQIYGARWCHINHLGWQTMACYP